MTVAGPVALPGPPSAVDSFRRAWQLTFRYPRQTMLPLLVTQLPVAIISAAATVVLYATVFEAEPVYTLRGMIDEGATAQLFALAVIEAVGLVFGLIGTAATMLALEALDRGKPKSLVESLDPPFTRLGGLIVLAVVFALLLLSVSTIIALIFVPYVTVRLGVTFNAYISENLGPMAAIRRSWRLMAGNMLRFVWLAVLTIPAVLLLFAANAVAWAGDDSSRTSQIASSVVQRIAGGVLSIPILAFITATATVYYLSIRARHDGPKRPV